MKCISNPEVTQRVLNGLLFQMKSLHVVSREASRGHFIWQVIPEFFWVALGKNLKSHSFQERYNNLNFHLLGCRALFAEARQPAHHPRLFIRQELYLLKRLLYNKLRAPIWNMKVAWVSAKTTKQSQGSLRAAVPDEDRCLRQVVNGFFTVYSPSLLPPCLPPVVHSD